jgi:hypothetical protein
VADAATRSYRGYIAEHDQGEATDVLFLTGVSEPLSEAIEDDLDELGSYLTVRYFIADTERSLEELDESLIRQIVGAGEADYHSHYSEITGYLWTDENLMVGGHDLLDELRSHKGKFAHLEITYSKEAA